MAKLAITVCNSRRAKKKICMRTAKLHVSHTQDALKTDWDSETQKNSVGEIKNKGRFPDRQPLTQQLLKLNPKLARKSTKKSTDYATT